LYHGWVIRRILVATDGSEAAMAAVLTAVDLTLSLGGKARLDVVAAVDYAGVPSMLAKQPAGAPDLLSEQAEEALQLAAAAAFAAGLQVETHLVNDEPVAAVLSVARAMGSEVIVAGFQGRSRLVRLVMGSVAGRLVRASPLPVLLVPGPAQHQHEAK
jgi:nucleotide-binding universal stress UspA family protein